MEVQSVYFPKSGSENTEETLALAKRRAEELGIRTIVVASTSGETGVKAVKTFANYKVVIVTHSAGLQARQQELWKPPQRSCWSVLIP